ncbi:hypothetical protein ASL20_09795 [Cupriavidus necator]|uniref:hypothetical protein n=1 Tax=Cupriavidus necator TaxID=106590 RepID=UPI00073559AE|nr:hypothetical protein [Cupriavidus necator]KUE88905.1 hypothetical protein ASL20_09795 [Cupriavidus necator]
MKSTTQKTPRRSGCADLAADDMDLSRRVLEHLRGNPLQRFSEPMLARRFGVSARTLYNAMRPALESAEAASDFVETSIRVYYFPRTPHPLPERIVGRGELKGYETEIRRLCEMRMAPRGAGWRL